MNKSLRTEPAPEFLYPRSCSESIKNTHRHSKTILTVKKELCTFFDPKLLPY